jgi:hypothetical protein
MNLLQKIRRFLLVLALAPLYWLEEREKEKKLQERLKRINKASNAQKMRND